MDKLRGTQLGKRLEHYYYDRPITQILFSLSKQTRSTIPDLKTYRARF